MCVSLTAQAHTEPSVPTLPLMALPEGDAACRPHSTAFPQAPVPAVQLQGGTAGEVSLVPLPSLEPILGPFRGNHRLGPCWPAGFPVPLRSHCKLKQFPLALLSTLSPFLFQRHLGPLNADGYTPEPVGEHLRRQDLGLPQVPWGPLGTSRSLSGPRALLQSLFLTKAPRSIPVVSGS